MQTVDERPETLHLYVVREKEKHPERLPMALSTLYLCILIGFCVFVSSIGQPEVRTVLRVPAVFPPLQTFRASVQIVPTGVKTIPATFAHGILTITNGSILSQALPKGMIINSVVLDAAVFVPGGSANGYGYTTVAAHALSNGKAGNIPAFSIDVVYGTSLLIRNLSPFTGGKNSSRVKIITLQDRHTALDSARAFVATEKANRGVYLAYPCAESSFEKNSLCMSLALSLLGRICL